MPTDVAAGLLLVSKHHAVDAAQLRSVIDNTGRVYGDRHSAQGKPSPL